MANCVFRLTAAFGICCLLISATHGDERSPTLVEQTFAAIERRYSIQPARIRHVAYFQPPVLDSPNPDGPPMSGPPPMSTRPERYVISAPMHPSVSNEQAELLHEPRHRSMDLIFGIEFLPMESHLTRAEFGPWPADPGGGARLNLAFEDATGLGFRTRFWGIGFDDSPPARDVEVLAEVFDLDFYKRMFIGGTELVVGGGTTSRSLEFNLPSNSYSEFKADGISLFGEFYYPLAQSGKVDLAFVGRGRFSLVDGEWRDTTGTVIASTDHDMMSVVEAAFGFEMRRYFGKWNNHYWSVGLLAEHQRWDSQWMGGFLGSSVGASGANINLGVAW